VALAIARFIAFEVGCCTLVRGSLAAFWRWTFVAVLGIEAVIHVAVKVGRTVKPVSGTDEATADEPLGAIVAVGGAVVGSVVVVAVGAAGLGAKGDGDLSFCCRGWDEF